MDYLQYWRCCKKIWGAYKRVLNLVINGLPSIHVWSFYIICFPDVGFKPCYKWITFNTLEKQESGKTEFVVVLNLVINGLPSIQTHQY